ncbi:MAG: type IV secretion system DNA-binding domain-containing protein [Clostridia bacterium]|nr:type IV secretion system DNA-binding domain-containing protein [Clostridia bacterium]
MSAEFLSICEYLPARLKKSLLMLDGEKKSTCEEIRLRANKPLCLTVKNKVLYVSSSGQTSEHITGNTVSVSISEIKETFLNLCKNSVYAHEKELKQGFIILPYGSRAGVCGNFGDSALCDVSSVNIRIAHEVIGCADTVLPYIKSGTVILGAPGSGKTTLLRDIVRMLSYKNKRISVIDSRGEISGSSRGVSYLDLGPNTDILLIKNKALGCEMALRTLYPEIIAFDEIGNMAELKSVMQLLNAGVSIITTAHIGNENDILRRNITRSLLESGAVENVVLLSEKSRKIPRVFSVSEILSNYDY